MTLRPEKCEECGEVVVVSRQGSFWVHQNGDTSHAPDLGPAEDDREAIEQEAEERFWAEERLDAEQDRQDEEASR